MVIPRKQSVRAFAHDDETVTADRLAGDCERPEPLVDSHVLEYSEEEEDIDGASASYISKQVLERPAYELRLEASFGCPAPPVFDRRGIDVERHDGSGALGNRAGDWAVSAPELDHRASVEGCYAFDPGENRVTGVRVALLPVERHELPSVSPK